MKLKIFGPLMCLIAIGCKGGAEPAADPESGPIAVKTAKAESKTIRELLPVDGVFTTAEGDVAKLAPTQAGKLASVLVKEGDTVQAGQLLASIDRGVLSAQQSGAQAGATAASIQAKQSEINVQSAKADYESGLNTAHLALETAIAQRKNDVEQAQTDLDRLRAGARPLEISQAEQAVHQAQVSRDKASAEYTRNKKLFAEGFVSGQDLDASKAAFELAESSLTQSKQQLALLKEGARKEEIKAAQQRLSSAKELGDKRVQQAYGDLDRAKNGRLTVQAKQSELSSTRTLASQKAADAMAASQSSKNGEIRAPFSGIISRRILNKGDSADSTSPVFELVRSGARADFVGTISPRDAQRISKGMSATVKDNDGAVGRVMAVGIPDSQTGQVAIRISFDRAHGTPTMGSASTANIILKTQTNAVSVPDTAIVTKDEKSYVYVVNKGVAKMTEVQKGATDNGFVAIGKGLKLGDEVVLIGQHELSDGAKVEVEKPEKPDVKEGDAKAGDEKKADEKKPEGGK